MLPSVPGLKAKCVAQIAKAAAGSYPGHHINDKGQFDSDKFADLPAGLVAINTEKPRNWPGLLLIADAYQEKDSEFADDLRGSVLAQVAKAEAAKGGGA